MVHARDCVDPCRYDSKKSPNHVLKGLQLWWRDTDVCKLNIMPQCDNSARKLLTQPKWIKREDFLRRWLF